VADQGQKAQASKLRGDKRFNSDIRALSLNAAMNREINSNSEEYANLRSELNAVRTNPSDPGTAQRLVYLDEAARITELRSLIPSVCRLRAPLSYRQIINNCDLQCCQQIGNAMTLPFLTHSNTRFCFRYLSGFY
jgi:hypothetical protein